MKLVSIQTGKVQETEFKSQKVLTAIFKSPVQGEIQVKKLGLVGDEQADRKHHGGLDKACYAFSLDAYRKWELFSKDAPEVPGAFGENLTIDSFSEENLCIGDELIFRNCRMQITSPRIPCSRLNIRFQNTSAVKTFTNHRRPGLYLRVLQEGAIAASENVRLEKSEKTRVTVNEIFHVAMKLENIPGLSPRIESLHTMSDETKKWLIGLNDSFK